MRKTVFIQLAFAVFLLSAPLAQAEETASDEERIWSALGKVDMGSDLRSEMKGTEERFLSKSDMKEIEERIWAALGRVGEKESQ